MEAHKNEGTKLEPADNEARGEEREEARLGGEKHSTQAKSTARKVKNNVRKMRTERMMSKAELARRAGLSTLTVDRVERGMSSRMDTKRKILEALGLKPQDRVMVFGDAEED
jgi:DNA-binding XRE family transcriptional regulator